MLNNPVICIPRLNNKNISKNFIKNIFRQYQWGVIYKVDIINNKAFIYFKSWNNNEKTQIIKNRFLKGETLNIIYNNPWFWKCSVKK